MLAVLPYPTLEEEEANEDREKYLAIKDPVIDEIYKKALKESYK